MFVFYAVCHIPPAFEVVDVSIDLKITNMSSSDML